MVSQRKTCRIISETSVIEELTWRNHAVHRAIVTFQCVILVAVTRSQSEIWAHHAVPGTLHKMPTENAVYVHTVLYSMCRQPRTDFAKIATHYEHSSCFHYLCGQKSLHTMSAAHVSIICVDKNRYPMWCVKISHVTQVGQIYDNFSAVILHVDIIFVAPRHRKTQWSLQSRCMND